MTPEQLQRISDALDHDDAHWRDVADDDPPGTTMAELAANDRARSALGKIVAEHAAMTEQLRWKRQSDEPAPEGVEVVGRKPGTEPLVTIGDDMRVEQRYFDCGWIEVPK